MVGDPSGKSEERNLLSEETLANNLAGIKAQLEKFLDFDSSKPNAAEMANNYDWFKNFSFLDFIRDIGKHITVNYMMAKDSVKKRLEGEIGMSVHRIHLPAWSRDMIFTGCIKIRIASCRWVAATNGAISLPAPN